MIINLRLYHQDSVLVTLFAVSNLVFFYSPSFQVLLLIFFFKQKTAYEVRISDWSSDVCSSDLGALIDDPALVALLGAEVDVAERVRAEARAVPPGEPRGADGRAVPPGEDLGPETHGGSPSADGRCCASLYRAGPPDHATRSPSSIPSSTQLPPAISSTATTGSPTPTGASECGVVLTAIRAIVPSARTKIMSSGISVFFIQKLAGRGRVKGKSMPAPDERLSRNMSPRACSSGVRATSTVKSCVPVSLRIWSGIRSSAGRVSRAAAISAADGRSEEHTSELQSLMRISYAVFCLKKTIKHLLFLTTSRHPI